LIGENRDGYRQGSLTALMNYTTLPFYWAIIHKIVKKTGRTELLKKCFAAARNANPQAALVLNDGGYHSFYQVVQACPKPSYQALKSLIRDEWWTGRSAFVTDENGRSSFRGFLGQYQLTCRDGAAGFSVSEKGQCQVKMTMP